MTIPYMMNCSHSDDGWCLQCVGKLQLEVASLKVALSRARHSAREYYGVTTRNFANTIGMTPTELCKLTDDAPTTAPDFVD